MLLALLSDVHANLPALEAILADAQHFRPDAYVVAGDLSGGPHPAETIGLLRSRLSHIIRGNGEGYLLQFWQGDAPLEWQTQQQFGFMRWNAYHVQEEDREFITALPEELSVTLASLPAIRVAHGSPGRPTGGIHPERDGGREVEEALARMEERVLVCGHTHEQWQAQVDGRLVVNPGAVCGTCDGTVGARYALLEWRGGRWQAKLKQVDYNIAEVRRAFRDSGLLDEGGAFARAVVAGIETGVDVTRALLGHANRLKEARGFGGARFVSDELWDEAATTFDWQRYERGAQ
jgi:predicted phosphodiesterase